MSMKGGEFIGGLLVGVLIGGVLGLLFAPESGEEIRQRIKDTAGDYKERAVSASSDLIQKGKEALREKKEQIASGLRRGEEEA